MSIFDDLDPAWKPIALAIDADLIQQGIRCLAFCGRRLYKDQRLAFNTGASKCDGIKNISLHQAGLATDWVALDSSNRPTWDYVKFADIYKAIRDTIVKHGGEAGADWKDFPDPPHGQIKA